MKRSSVKDSECLFLVVLSRHEKTTSSSFEGTSLCQRSRSQDNANCSYSERLPFIFVSQNVLYNPTDSKGNYWYSYLTWNEVFCRLKTLIPQKEH
jgi:hypothetical protein